MKKVNKSRLITLAIFIGIAAIIFFSLTSEPKVELTDEQVAICIGEKATLYVNLGCPHCESQKKAFGENVKHLKVFDCYYYGDLCKEEEIRAYPTWKIENKQVLGRQSIENLRVLTGC